MSNIFFNLAFYEIMWKKVVESDRLRIKCDACALHAGYLKLQTHTHIILIAFPLQQWLLERASMLRYTYIAYRVVVYRSEKLNINKVDN